MKDPLGMQTLTRAIERGDRLEAQCVDLRIAAEQERVRGRRILATLATLLREVIADRNTRRIDGQAEVESVRLAWEKITAEGDDPKVYLNFDTVAKEIELRLTPFPGQRTYAEEPGKPRIVLPRSEA